jgi:hypothetical protein
MSVTHMPLRLGSIAGMGKLYSRDRLIGRAYYDIHVAQHRGAVEATGTLAATTTVLHDAGTSGALQLELETGSDRVDIVMVQHIVTGLSQDAAHIRVSGPVPGL